MHAVLLTSVANSWQNFSARSTKKFGRWRKSPAPHKIYSYTEEANIIGFSTFTMKIVKQNRVYQWETSIFCQKYDYFSAKSK
jgi:hypothetical protein